MNEDTIKIRLMYDDDFNAVVQIDEKVLAEPRPEYYKLKFERDCVKYTVKYVQRKSILKAKDDG